MTGAEVQANYFSPLNYFLYMFVIFALMIAYYQWQWHKKAKDCVKLVIVQPDGSSDVDYVPKEGNTVSITNKDTGLTKLWPITKLSTFDMLYPGDGFIPKFLQKKIRTTIVDGTDWEPMVNRGQYSDNVASPDVKAFIRDLAEGLPEDKKATLIAYADSLVTAPTREMIASPAVLGNIAKEKISELAVTIAKDIVNPLNEAIKKLGQQINPMIVYIGFGLIAIALVYLIIQQAQSGNSQIMEQLDKIKNALGIKPDLVPVPGVK
jgi:translation elongation factor EF-1beta